jgi:hypothetical protein
MIIPCTFSLRYLYKRAEDVMKKIISRYFEHFQCMSQV